MSNAFNSIPSLTATGTGVTMTRLGFGCARLFANSEIRASARLVEVALEVGIRHFDTAPSYSWGQSEQVLGNVLKGVRDVTITTKVGTFVSPGAPSLLSTLYRRTIRPALAFAPTLKSTLLRLAHVQPTSAPEAPRQVLSAEAIERSLAQSLERLQRESVELFLLHDPDSFFLDHDAHCLLERLRAAGTIRAYGEAWGGIPTCSPIGRLVQQRYPTDQLGSARPSAVQQGHVTFIFHGLLRQKDHSTGTPKLLAEAFARHPSSAFLFSASSSQQIRQVANAIQQIRDEAQSIAINP